MRVGTDVQSIAEVASAIRSHGARYLRRVYTPQEVEACGGPWADPELLAPGLTARFCAKEATIKLLRVEEQVPDWRDIEVVRSITPWPLLRLTGLALLLAREQELSDLSLSISHSGGVAVATVVGVVAAGKQSDI